MLLAHKIVDIDSANIKNINVECISQLLKDKNNIDAKEKMVVSNIPFLKLIINKMGLSQHHLYEDVFSEGIIGLLKSVERYCPEKGSFTTFSIHYIKSHITSFLRKSDLVVIPADKYWELRRTKNDESGVVPDYAKFSYLHDGSYEDEEYDVFGCTIKYIEDEREKNEEDKDYIKAEKIKKYISQLGSREAEIVSRRLGLNEYEPMDFIEIAKVVKVSRTRVQQIFNRSIEKIKEKFQV